MISSKAGFAACIVLIPLLSSCGPRSRGPEKSCNGSLDPTLRQYQQGVAEAVREIALDDMTIYTVGWPQSGNDPETGLPLKVIGGDAVDLFLLLRMEAHNHVIRRYLEEMRAREKPE